MGKIITYGVGGYDETKPNNNIVEEIETEDVLETETDTLKQIPQSAIDSLANQLENPSINSIAELKSVLASFLSKIE